MVSLGCSLHEEDDGESEIRSGLSFLDMQEEREVEKKERKLSGFSCYRKRMKSEAEEPTVGFMLNG